MVIFFQIIVAHLLADFVLQSNKLVHEKEHRLEGQLKHVSILTLCMGIFIFPFLNSSLGWLILGAIAVTHLFQDYLKVRYENLHNKNRKKVWPFFLDQAVHLAVIIASSFALSGAPHMELGPILKTVYFSKDLMFFLACAIFTSFALDIVIYEYRRTKKRKLRYKRHYAQMMSRFLAFLIFYLIILGLWGFGN